MASYKGSGNRNITVFVTVVKGEGKFLKFFFLNEIAAEELRKVEVWLSEYGQKLESYPALTSSYQVPHGSVCFAKSQAKRQWCRARVEAADVGGHQVVVKLVDYGNTEVVPVTDVRKADANFPSIQPLAVECILADVAPSSGNEWSPEAIQLCEEHLLFQKLSGYIVSDCDKLPIIRVAKLGESEPFVQRLINAGMARVEAFEAKAAIFNGPGFKLLPLEVNTTHLVTVSCVVSSQNFHVQLSPAEVELKNVMNSIEVRAGYENLAKLTAPVVGLPCLTQVDPSTRRYYRAIIRDVQQSICKISLVDYGDTLIKDIQTLRIMPPEFLSLPAQAIRCALRDPLSVSADVLKEFCKGRVYLMCHVVGNARDTYIVSLSSSEKDVHVTKSELRLASNAYTIKPLTINASIDVTLSYSVGPHKFYCHFLPYKSILDELASKLELSESLKLPEISDVVYGYPVCARYSEDGLWYRGKVISFDDINNIEVFFVDYGNTDIVALTDLRKVTSDLFSYPIQAYKFALHGFSSKEAISTPVVCEWFEEVCVEPLIAEVKSFSNEDGYGVVLRSTKNVRETINEQLQNNLKVHVTYPALSKSEIMYVTHFTMPYKFFGQLTKFDQDVVANMQDELNEFYQNATSKDRALPSVGDLVCAKFSEDELFYRALVESVGSSGADVFLADYGNREHVEFKNIFQLSPQFAKHPYFGIECFISNHHIPSMPGHELRDLLLESEVEVRLIEETSAGKWEVSFTESFAGNSKILQLCEKTGGMTSASKNFNAESNNRVKNHNIDNQKSPQPSEITFKGHEMRAFDENENFNHSKQLKKSSSLASQLSREVTVENLEDYDQTTIPNESYKEVFVSHVISPSEFYCQLTSNISKLQLLMNSINQLYKKSVKVNELTLDSVKIGMPCCCVYEADGSWYRGKIESQIGNFYQVFYVDYGNTESTEISKVKRLHQDFFSLSPQALRCSLFNTIPQGSSWSQNDIDAFVEMTAEKSFVTQFVEMEANDTHLVNLFSINKLQNDILNKDFVKHGHGHLKNSNKLLVMNSLAASTSLEFPKLDVQLGCATNVEVTWLTNAVQFFCQIKSHSTVFRRMMEEIQQHYSSVASNECVVDRPHVGMICIAQFSNDDAWYRASVVSVGKDVVQVYYVDYGNSENISKKKVKLILQDFATLPIQAVKCRLRGIDDSGRTLPQCVTDLFQGSSQCTFISSEEDFYIVNLVVKEKDIAAEMVKQKFAVYCQNEVSATLDVNCNIPKILPSNTNSFQKDQLISVVVSHIESPLQFWCQLVDETYQLNELMTVIESYCATSASSMAQNTTDLPSGSTCIAKYVEDNCWYRATVRGHKDSSVQVFFVDYGNLEDVNRSQMRHIHPDLVKLPAQAVECQLYGVPSVYSEQCSSRFRELVENAEELMAKIEDVTSSGLVISLFVVSDPDVEINVLEAAFDVSSEQLLQVENGLAFLPPEVPVGEQLGYISFIVNPHDLHIQLTRQKAELELLSEKLLEKCSKAEDDCSLTNVVPGTVCCARYSEDEQWYRAEVTNVKDGMATVFFVDFGNFDTVSAGSLKQLDVEMLKVPPYAIPCQLAHIRAADEQWLAAATDRISELTGDEDVNVSFLKQCLPVPVIVKKNGKTVQEDLIHSYLAIPDDTGVIDILTNTEQSDVGCETFPKRVLNASNLHVKIPFVASYDKFFVTATEWEEELNVLSEELQSVYGTSAYDDPTFTLQVECGKFCAARYSEDGAWYRAVVDKVDNTHLYVSFVDYGNSAMTTVEDVRKLHSRFWKQPPFAVECGFCNFKLMEGKENDVTAKLNDIADNDSDVEIEVISGNDPYVVQIRDFDNTLNEGSVLSLSSPPCDAVNVFDVEQTVEVVENHAMNESAEELVEKNSFDVQEQCIGVLQNSYPERLVVHEAKFSVSLSFVESWDKFYVTAIDWNEDFEALRNAIVEYVEKFTYSPPLFEDLQTGQLCLTRYNSDGLWYRAVVKDIREMGISVTFVDYGNSEVVGINDCWKLPYEIAKFPPFAVACYLHALHLAEGKEEEIKSELQAFVDEEVEVEMEIVGETEPYAVKMNCGDFVSHLINSDIAVSVESSNISNTSLCFEPEAQTGSGKIDADDEIMIGIDGCEEHLGADNSFVEQLESSSDSGKPEIMIDDGEMSCTFVYLERKLFSPKINARISFVQSWDKFYIIATEWFEEALIIRQLLEAEYLSPASSTLQLTDVHKNQPCIAKIAEDGSWRRAVISDVDGSNVFLHFVDSGKSDVTDSSCLKQMKPNIMEIPPLSVECRLYQIQPTAGSEVEILSRLQALCDFNTDLEIEVFGHHPPYEVRINSDIAFIDELVSEGLAVVDDPSSRLQDREAFKDNLKIAFVEEFELKRHSIPLLPVQSDLVVGELKSCETKDGSVVLYVVPAENEDSLAEQQNALQASYSDATEQASSVRKGEYYVAKFSEDNSWYRAQVVAHATDSVYMKFVDFGNTEVVPLSDVKELTQKFAETPQFAVECYFMGIKVLDQCDQAINRKLMQFESDYRVCICQLSNHTSEMRKCIKSVVADNTDVVDMLINDELVKQVFPVHQSFSEFMCKMDEHIIQDSYLNLFPIHLAEERDELQDKLKIAYDCPTADEVMCISQHRLYAAKKDSCWFRALVQNVNGISAFVNFVDFGFKHEVLLSDMRELQPEFCHIPPFCLCCVVSELHNTTCSKLRTLINIAEGKLVTCAIRHIDFLSGTYNVHVAVDEEDVLMQLTCACEITELESLQADHLMLEKIGQQGTSEEQQIHLIDESEVESVEFCEGVENVHNVPCSELQFEDVGDPLCVESESKYVSDNFLYQTPEADDQDIVHEHKHFFDECKTEGIEYFEKVESGIIMDISKASSCNEDFDGIASDHSDDGVCDVSVAVQPLCKDEEATDLSKSVECAAVLPDSCHGEIGAGISQIPVPIVAEDSELQCEVSQIDIDVSQPDVSESIVLEETDHSLCEVLDGEEDFDEPSNSILKGKLESFGISETEESDNHKSCSSIVQSEDVCDSINFEQSTVNKNANDEVESKTLEVSDSLSVEHSSVLPELCESHISSECDNQTNSEICVPESMPVSKKDSLVTEKVFQASCAESSKCFAAGKVEVYVVNVMVNQSSEIFFAVIPVEHKETSESLQCRLHEFYTQAPVDAFIGGKSEQCAIFSKNNWYRGIVHEVTGDQAVVLFTDYGHQEETHVSCLRKLDSQFLEWPSHIVICTLPGVKCFKRDEVEKRLVDQFLQKVILIDVLSTDVTCQVKPLDDENIVQKLISENLLTLQLLPHSIHPGENLAHVLYVSDETKHGVTVYLRLHDQQDDFKSLNEKLQCLYQNKLGVLPVEEANNTGLYAVEHQGTWKRCVVLKKEHSSLLYIVDEGKSIDSSNVLLQPLIFDFCLQPPFAIPCHINNVLCEATEMEILQKVKESNTKILAVFGKEENDGYYSISLNSAGELEGKCSSVIG